MWLRICILIASYAIELISCNKDDIEIKADIRVDPGLMRQLKQSLDDELEMGYFRGQSDPDFAMEVIKDNVVHQLLKEDLSEIALGKNAFLTKIQIYEERSQKKGKDSLEAIAGHVQEKLNLKNDLTPMVEEITAHYFSTLKRYFSDLTNERPNRRVDEEYIILDMVYFVPLIRRTIEHKFLTKILSLFQDDVPGDEIEILTSTLLTFNDNDRGQEMDYMCAAFKVCRPNPTFSSYLYKLLEEVLKLNDAKFIYVLTRCSQLLLSKQSLFQTVLRDDIAALLRTKMKNMATANVTEMREAVSFLHSIVIRRYKINHTNDNKLQMKAKSAFIILDIVDVAFGIDGAELYGTETENMISSVAEWSHDMVDSIDTSLYNFIQYFIEALNYNLSPRAREEIMSLADKIFYGDNMSAAHKKTQYLLTEGSKFVKGLLNRPSVDI